MSSPKKLGKVYLVGAGPGDPGLMTVRGLEVLAEADLILYDYLVNPGVLEHARHDCESICLGQHGRSRIWTQDEIQHRMIEVARGGQTVVRLKGGDPAIFGRGAEEAEALAAEHIPFEIVPGVTAAAAAMAYAGVPLTHRDYASAVVFLTGHERDDDQAGALDYSLFAQFPGTLVVYMGVTTAERWVTELIRGGKDPKTPAAIVRRCSLPDQQTFRCTLDEVPRVLGERHLRPPAVVIVGDVVRLTPEQSWFEQRPLFGRRILITRPCHQAHELGDLFRQLGAHVLYQPAIEIGPAQDWTSVDRAINELNRFAWIVFSSANGVQYFLQRLRETGRDMRALAPMRIAAIGPGTRDELAAQGLIADLVPESYVAEALADALAPHVGGLRVLLIRASRGREVLAERLRAARADVEQVVVYQSTDVSNPDPLVLEQLEAGNIDWVTVTSSAIAASLWRLFGGALQQSRLASISPITTAELAKYGLTPAAEASEQTMRGLVAAVLRAESEKTG